MCINPIQIDLRQRILVFAYYDTGFVDIQQEYILRESLKDVLPLAILKGA